MKPRKAFTLIELLIVVAIIAILAAIAVPNFLEAQVRSKVSRMRSDLRTVATGLESYMVDFSHYPLSTYPNYNPPSGAWDPSEYWKFWPGFEGTAGSLTTPIAYLSSRAPMEDVFRKAHKFPSKLAYEIMYLPSDMYNPDWNYLLASASTYAAQQRAYGLWVIRSAGPDTWYQNQPGMDGDYGAGGWNRASYDATNGTVSAGDIMRSQKRSQQEHAGPAGAVF